MNNRFKSKYSKIFRLAVLTTVLGTGLAPAGALAMGLSGELAPNLQFPQQDAFADTAPRTCFLIFCTTSGDVTRDKALATSLQSGDDK